jgi:hypothetical protein
MKSIYFEKGEKMETRICDACRNEYPLTSEFFYTGKNEKGVYFRRKCKSCYNKYCYGYQKKRLTKNEAAPKLICSCCEKETNYLNEKKFCSVCEEEERLYLLKVQEVYKRAEEEEARENEWKIEAAKKTYQCRKCELEKTFDDMRIIPYRKKVDTICKICNAAEKKIYAENRKVKTFAMAQAKAKKEN